MNLWDDIPVREIRCETDVQLAVDDNEMVSILNELFNLGAFFPKRKEDEKP